MTGIRRNGKQSVVLTARVVRYFMMLIMVLAVSIGFLLQRKIMKEHKIRHQVSLEQHNLHADRVKAAERQERHRELDIHHAEDHGHEDEDPHMHEGDHGSTILDYQLPVGFQNVLERAKRMKSHCDNVNLPLVESSLEMADLPAFGIIDSLQSYSPNTEREAAQWDCKLPPETECGEEQLTAIFLGYRPDRLVKFAVQVRRMTFKNDEVWNGLFKEVILVWNGDRELSETEKGQKILRWAEDPTINFRIVYPLKEGFPNDLMNRYHPRFNVTTKGILFYDDDGPFYSVKAVTSAFELWKRNSNAEIGAMARRLDVGERAAKEKSKLPSGEREWVSNCRAIGDQVRYNYESFAQTGANMALPSGSLLHRDYLCWIWHPALEEVRQFVRKHPVHPDDVTVSTIVSHISGRSPKVYSRRINRRENTTIEDETDRIGNDLEGEPSTARRRLLWDDGNTQIWASKRENAVNSLLGYFGSLNSGSEGWCFNTPYYDKNKNLCVPDQAKTGMIPWMDENHMPLKHCP